MFREARGALRRSHFFVSMCRRKGSLRTVSLLCTIQSCDVREDTPFCAYRVRPGEYRKCELGDCFFLFYYLFIFFLFCFFSKAGWMLIKDEFPAGTDYWGWNVQMQMFVSVCALALLGSSSILLWFLCNVPLFKGDPPIRLVPALLRRPWLVTLI